MSKLLLDSSVHDDTETTAKVVSALTRRCEAVKLATLLGLMRRGCLTGLTATPGQTEAARQLRRVHLALPLPRLWVRLLPWP